MIPTETSQGFCHVCGNNTIFKSYEPVEVLCKRNSFLCDVCGASARNRHIAKTILELFPSYKRAPSLVKFAEKFTGDILITCASGPMFDALKSSPGLVASEYIDGAVSGELKNGVLCQDIQRTSFAGDTFDFIITEDVLEHVPFPERAFAEIRHILKPGGYHVSTIPVKWDLFHSRARAVLENGQVKHLLDPEYHLDPLREGGVLAYTDFGHDIVERYCSIIGNSVMLEAHGDRHLEKEFAIYNNWVFLSQKRLDLCQHKH